jgi:hypothetical protein
MTESPNPPTLSIAYKAPLFQLSFHQPNLQINVSIPNSELVCFNSQALFRSNIHLKIQWALQLLANFLHSRPPRGPGLIKEASSVKLCYRRLGNGSVITIEKKPRKLHYQRRNGGSVITTMHRTRITMIYDAPKTTSWPSIQNAIS